MRGGKGLAAACGREVVRWAALVSLAASCSAANAAGSTVGDPPSAAVQRAWSGTWVTSVESTGQGIQDCCRGPGTQVPFTPKYRAVRDAYANQALDNTQVAITNSQQCLTPGVPGILTHPISFEILFSLGRATMLVEDGSVRRLWLSNDRPPPYTSHTALGYSIARWEGQTLVVHTDHLSPAADLFMSSGIHMTDHSVVEERLHLAKSGDLLIDTTVTDPEMFTKPFRYTRNYKKVPGTFEVGCAANNRDDDSKSPDLAPPF